MREEKRPRFDQNRIEERAGVDTDLPISRRRDLYRRPRWRPERGPGILGAVCAMPLHKLPLAFEARGTTGLVSVRVWPNDDPPSVGKAPGAEGFPVCEATVSTDLAGYDALFGWVQLVGIERSSAAERQFEPDPLEILDDLDLPFGFYGVRPTLFDAPSRQDRQQQLDWLAHSFLCMSPGAVMERAVRPVTAFQWGFQLSNGCIALVPPSELGLTAWDAHRQLLAAAYPSWRFDPAP